MILKKFSMTLFRNDPDGYGGDKFDLELYKPEINLDIKLLN